MSEKNSFDNVFIYILDFDVLYFFIWLWMLIMTETFYPSDLLLSLWNKVENKWKTISTFW